MPEGAVTYPVDGPAEWRRTVARMEAVRRFARRVGHDVNNFLAAILTTTELLELDIARGAPNPEDAAELRAHVQRAAAYTREILRFANEDAGPVAQPADLNALVVSRVPVLRQRLEPDIRLVTTLAEDVPPARADATDLVRILDALVAHAGGAVPDGGTVTIATSRAAPDAAHPSPSPGQCACLMVAHTGPGLDATARARLFEPDLTVRDSEPGSGFELAAVYGLVHAGGGWIDAGRDPDRRATLAVVFPAAALEMESQPVPSGEGGHG